MKKVVMLMAILLMLAGCAEDKKESKSSTDPKYNQPQASVQANPGQVESRDYGFEEPPIMKMLREHKKKNTHIDLDSL